MTTATTISLDELAEHRDAVRAVMTHATMYRNGHPDFAFHAVADANQTPPEQIDNLPGVTPQVAQAYRAVRKLDPTLLCWILDWYTDALRLAEDAIEALANSVDTHAWISLIRIRDLTRDVEQPILDLVLRKLTATDRIELSYYGDDPEMGSVYRDKLNRNALDYDGHPVRWLRFTTN